MKDITKNMGIAFVLSCLTTGAWYYGVVKVRNNHKTETTLRFSLTGGQGNVTKITKSPFSEIEFLKIPNSRGAWTPSSL